MTSPERGGAAEWVFISYRRADSGGYVQSLYDKLGDRYSPGAVFFDADRIDIGADFPLRLKEAVQAARLLIVVIGPDWLRIVNERAASPKVDYVCEELKLALVRRRQGEKLTILPVLVGNAGVPDDQDLAEILRADLGALTTINAHSLRPGRDWADDFKRLFEKTDPIRDTLPTVYAAQRQVEERLRKEVIAILDRPEMAAIRTAWCADPLQDRCAADANELMLDLNNAIMGAHKAWGQSGSKLTPLQVQLIKEGCYDLVTRLYRLAVDIEAVRAWQASDSPVPVQQSGTAAVVVAVAEGWQVRASPRSKGADFYTDRTVDLDVGLDAGIGEDRFEQAFGEFWLIAFDAEAPSARAQRENDLRRLRNRIVNLSRRDKRSFGLSGVIGTADHHTALRGLAERLAVKAYGRTGQMGSLLRVEEDALADALCLCIEDIEKIQ